MLTECDNLLRQLGLMLEVDRVYDRIPTTFYFGRKERSILEGWWSLTHPVASVVSIEGCPFVWLDVDSCLALKSVKK